MFDGHIHFAEDLGRERLTALFAEAGYDGFCVQCIPKGGQRDVLADAFSLRDKTRMRVLVFGGVPRGIYTLPQERQGDALVSACAYLRDRGCDGLKLLEGKPSVRKRCGVPAFDSGVWEPTWAYLEQTRFPVVLHLNDPEVFWDAACIPAHARDAGWFYDESFPDNLAQLCEMRTVLARHPRLKLLFPHYLFLGARLSELTSILDAFPYVMTDTTPALEQYVAFAAHAAETRAFFSAYADRVCYGTDIGARDVVRASPSPVSPAETRSRIALVQRFLTSESPWLLDNDGAYVQGIEPVTMPALGLSPSQTAAINGENFLRWVDAI